MSSPDDISAGSPAAGSQFHTTHWSVVPCLTGADGLIAYAELASQLDITENALKMAVYRLRKRYGELVRAEIALVVDSPAEIEQEIRCLIAAAAE
jgi:RNA polymerase sigma-70 factor (ECF subfamily)